MPRTPRPGGPRAGQPGQAYANRTDLNTERSLPVRAVPGQTYGQVQAQTEAQRAVPMAPSPQPSGLPAPAAPGGPSMPALPPTPPGAAGPLTRPTERPLEPVTAGIASGPGPGPEALPPPPAAATAKVSALLAAAAASTGSPTLSNLAARAQASGQ